MKHFGVILLGILAITTTVYAVLWYRYFGGLLLLLALPFWMLFLVFLVRAAKP